MEDYVAKMLRYQNGVRYPVVSKPGSRFDLSVLFAQANVVWYEAEGILPPAHVCLCLAAY